MPKRSTVFVSHAWDDFARHGRWLEDLCARLHTDGFDVRFDKRANRAGDDWERFVNEGLRDAGQVLMVCTPIYKKKLDDHTAGSVVAYEGQRIRKLHIDRAAHIVPLLRDGEPRDAIPTPFDVRAAVDFRNDAHFEARYRELLEGIAPRHFLHAPIDLQVHFDHGTSRRRLMVRGATASDAPFDPASARAALARRSSPEVLGRALFDLAFGAEGWRDLMRALQQAPTDEPSAHQVRCRIVETGAGRARLAAFPWKLLRAGDVRLVDKRAHDVTWTVEALRPGAEPKQRLVLPLRTLALISESAAGVPLDPHLRDLGEIMQRASASKHPVEIAKATTIEDARRHLQDLQPNLLYVVSRATQDGCGFELGGEAFTFGALRAAVRGRVPSLVYLNGAFEEASPEGPLTDVPLLVVQRSAQLLEDHLELAHSWLADVLVSGADPRRAADRFPRMSSGLDRPSVEALRDEREALWASATLHTGAIEVSIEMHQERRPWRAETHVDRHGPRAKALQALMKLAHDKTERVAVMIGLAEPGNHVEHLAEQLHDELLDLGRGRLALKRFSVPIDGSATADSIAWQTWRRLPVDPAITAPKERLRAARPRGARGLMPLFLFDYGAFGSAFSRPLKTRLLSAWWQFALKTLAPVCPDEVRAAVLIAVEAEDLSKLRAQIDRMEAEAEAEHEHRIHVLPLEEIEEAPKSEIKRFLLHEDSGCPDNLASAFAAELHGREGGERYDHVLRLIRKVRAVGFFEAARRWGLQVTPLRDEPDEDLT